MASVTSARQEDGPVAAKARVMDDGTHVRVEELARLQEIVERLNDEADKQERARIAIDTARADLNAFNRYVAKRYKLNEGDGVRPADGLIVRKAQAPTG